MEKPTGKLGSRAESHPFVGLRKEGPIILKKLSLGNFDVKSWRVNGHKRKGKGVRSSSRSTQVSRKEKKTMPMPLCTGGRKEKRTVREILKHMVDLTSWRGN